MAVLQTCPGVRSQDDTLVGRLGEDYGYRQGVFRRASEWAVRVSGGHADTLDGRLGDSRTIGIQRLFCFLSCINFWSAV